MGSDSCPSPSCSHRCHSVVNNKFFVFCLMDVTTISENLVFVDGLVFVNVGMGVSSVFFDIEFVYLSLFGRRYDQKGRGR